MSENTFEKYGSDFQKKIVQALLVEKDFAEQMIDILDVNYFGLKYLRVVVAKYFNYYNKYNTFPSFSILVTILRDELSNDGEEKLIKRQILEYLKHIKSSPLNGDMKYVKEKSHEFCKSQSMRKSLIRAVEMIEGGNYEGVVEEVKSSMDLGSERNLGHDYKSQIKDRMNIEEIDTIRTGFDVLDHVDVFNGGLGKGEIGVVVAPTGVGKSLFCCILAANAMRNGKNVVYYTLELDENTVGRRIDANFSGIPQNQLSSYEDVVASAIEKEASGNLYIKYYPTKTASVQTIRAHLNRLAIRRFVPDLVIVDYADVMKGARHADQKRLEIESVYEDLRGMAGELGVPVWTCSQVNRAGSDNEVVELDDVAESYNKTMVADVVITLSRRLKDRMNKTGRIYIAKNRRGQDGLVYPLRLDPLRVHCDIFDKMDNSIVERMAKNSGGFDVSEIINQQDVGEAIDNWKNRDKKGGDKPENESGDSEAGRLEIALAEGDHTKGEDEQE